MGKSSPNSVVLGGGCRKKSNSAPPLDASQWGKVLWTEGLSNQQINAELRRRKHQRRLGSNPLIIYGDGEVPEDIQKLAAEALRARKLVGFRSSKSALFSPHS